RTTGTPSMRRATRRSSAVGRGVGSAVGRPVVEPTRRSNRRAYPMTHATQALAPATGRSTPTDAWDYAEIPLLRHLKSLGFEPSTIYDIGGSTGAWSASVSAVWPGSAYHLFDPLMFEHDRYSDAARATFAARLNFTPHAVALGEHDGTAEFW